MKVSFWQTVIRTEFTEATRRHFYILFIGSFSRFFSPLFSRLCERFRLTSYPYPHLELSLSVCVCCRTGAHVPDGDSPRIREDFPSFNKQLNDTVLRINLLKEAQERCGVEQTTGHYPAIMKNLLPPFRISAALTETSGERLIVLQETAVLRGYSSARQPQTRLWRVFMREKKA